MDGLTRNQSVPQSIEMFDVKKIYINKIHHVFHLLVY